MSDTIVGIGRLELIRFIDATGIVRDLTFGRGWWLAWSGPDSTGDMLVVRMTGKAGEDRADIDALRQHRRFHGAEASRLLESWWTPPPKVRRMLGWIQAIRYDVPDATVSDKAGNRWHHKLGDFGRADGGDRSNDKQYWPSLHCTLDRPYAWWIQRRKGNRYRLADWLIG